MHPLSDKDLDRLSREAAEQYDVEQNTSGWDKLELKLNKHLPEKGKKERRRFLFFIWLLALLSGGGLLWMLTLNDSPKFITLKEGSSGTPQKSPSANRSTDQPSTDQQSLENKTKNNNSEPPDTKAIDRSLSIPDNEPKAKADRNTTVSEKNIGLKNPQAHSQKPSPDKNLSGNDNTVPENGIPIVTKKKKHNLTDPVGTKPSGTLPAEQSGNKDTKDNKNKTASDDNKSQNDIPSPSQNQQLPNKNQSVTDSTQQATAEQTKTIVDSNSTVTKTAVSKTKSGFKKGFEIALTASPDMSNVKFTNTDKIGYNVGIQIGYRLSQRWSVNTGVIYTRKNYTSQGKDFNPPKGSWLDNVKLDMVKGSCYMFDIPLNVRYDLNTNSNHRYFLSTGLSSYLMKEEDYHYHYQYANGNPGYRYRSYSSSEHYWLSILNISAGFEKKLSKRLSLQIEPYLKIPLSGVGYGRLQLNSYGMYFSLKFNTNKR